MNKGCALKPIFLIAHIATPVPKVEKNAKQEPIILPFEDDTISVLSEFEFEFKFDENKVNKKCGFAIKTTPNKANNPPIASTDVNLSLRKK